MTHDASRGPLPPPTASSTPAGWYHDPLAAHAWRWWDGHAWTSFTSPGPAPAGPAGGTVRGRRPRLPRWLSPPVVVCAPIVLLAVGALAVFLPVAVLAGLVPFVIVLPVLGWLDRVEPEPLASRLHALLWGGGVAVVIALVVNASVAAVLGETVALVVSAPVVEEAAKGLGVYWAVRRREIDGLSDGIVYAGWVALGFAVVEDMSYFATASVDGSFATVFVLRAILTPFAHPLFTIWIGWAIGRAVRDGRPVFPSVIGGYALAVGAHAAWNGSLALGGVAYDVDEALAAGVLLGALALFVVLFASVAVVLRRMRREEQQRFVRMVPVLSARYGLTADESQVLQSWQHLVRTRRSLGGVDRRRFDHVHGAIARLALLHERPGTIDPDRERVLVSQLDSARAAFARSRRAA